MEHINLNDYLPENDTHNFDINAANHKLETIDN